MALEKMFAKDNDEALLRLATAIKKTGYVFTTTTPATHERVNGRPENIWAQSLTDLLGWSRPLPQDQSSSIDQTLLKLMLDAHILVEVNQQDKKCWQSLIRMSTLDGELFLHSAYPTTAADSVFFGPDTYRFARAIKSFLTTRNNTHTIRRGVDIGCGAGPGAVLLSKALPEAEIFGVDINDAALFLTSLNAQLANVKVTSSKSDLLKNIDGQFDLIISNPPYLNDSTKRRYRHGGGELGSELSLSIIDEARQRLAPGGTLLLYTGSPIVNGKDVFLEEAKKILQNSDMTWSYEEMDPDVFGEELLTEAYSYVDRIAAVVLIATKPRNN